MKALVTGAAGFIGQSLVPRLIRDGWEVEPIDVSWSGRKFLDVRYAEDVETAMRGIDVVFHLAAVVGVDTVLAAGAEEVVDVDLVGTLNVLRAARARGTRVVYTSTSEASGKGDNLPYREDGDRLYGSTSTSRWCYAEAKALGEHLCLDFAAKGTPTTAVRLFNVYGPGHVHGVTARFARQILNDQPVTIVAPGNQTRCFAYVADIVDGLIRCATRDEAVGEVINLGSDTEVTVFELAKELTLVLQPAAAGLHCVGVTGRNLYGEGYEDIPRRVPDVSKAKKLLEWETTTSLPEGLVMTAPWLRETFGPK